MIAIHVATRLLAFVGKELVEIVRRPGAIVSLVLGPFLIMALFGLGYDDSGRSFRTVARGAAGVGAVGESRRLPGSRARRRADGRHDGRRCGPRGSCAIRSSMS